MIQFFKLLPTLLLFKDVSNVWKEEGLDVKTKPFWISRRFVGAVVVALTGFGAYQFGIKATDADVKTLTDALIGIGEAVGLIYGSIQIIVGFAKRTTKLGVKFDKIKKIFNNINEVTK